MKVIIAGSRTITNQAAVDLAMELSGFQVTTVLSGTAKGVDLLGEAWAESRRIPIDRYPADWKQYGKRAGFLRNQEMAEDADALVAVWDGESKGTKHMIAIARFQGLKIFVHEVALADWAPNVG